MVKKIALFLILFLFFAPNAWAITLLTEREALKEIFPGAETVVGEKKTASESELAEIIEGLGGRLIYHRLGKDWRELEARKEWTFYFGMKDGQRMGAAVILDEPGKWGKIRLIIRINTEGKIENAMVMRYEESRGRPIARRRFLKQFIGKGLNDPLEINKDIQAVSGATISSEAAAFVVRKAILLYQKLVK